MTTVKVAVLLALLTVINSAIAQDARARVNTVQEDSGEEGSPEQSCDTRLLVAQNRLDECNVAAEKARRTSTKQLATCNSRLHEAEEKISEDRRKIEELRASNLKLERRLTEARTKLQNKSQEVDELNNKLTICNTELNTTKDENQELTENVTKLQLIEEELREKLNQTMTLNQHILEQILNATTSQSTNLQDLTSQLKQDFITLNTNIESSSNSSIQAISDHAMESNQKSENLLREILLIKSEVDSGFATSAEDRGVHYNSLNNSQQQLLQLVEATKEKATLAAGGRIMLANNIYFFSGKNQLAWHDAKSFCTSQGLHLVTIESAVENQLILQQKRIIGMSDTWLGGSDEAQEDTWRWMSNGQTLTYNNWFTSQPNGGTWENCMEMRSDAKWHDWNCKTPQPFICKL